MPSQESIYDAVRERYGEIAARGGDSCCSGPSSCCDLDYSAEDLQLLPASVTDLSLGCGNPISAAGIQPGETILDLGSGAGIDCFFAARLAGPSGRVIGVDMTPEMLVRARENAQKLAASNVEFRGGHIEALPLDNASVDVVISNCVINLSPDKPQVFREMFRALRPGGRVAVSDVLTRGHMPEFLVKDLWAWSECVSGALPVEEYVAGLESAGFVDVRVQPKEGTLDFLARIPFGAPFSAIVTARKP